VDGVLLLMGGTREAQIHYGLFLSLVFIHSTSSICGRGGTSTVVHCHRTVVVFVYAIQKMRSEKAPIKNCSVLDSLGFFLRGVKRKEEAVPDSWPASFSAKVA